MCRVSYLCVRVLSCISSHEGEEHSDNHGTTVTATDKSTGRLDPTTGTWIPCLPCLLSDLKVKLNDQLYS